MASLHVLYSNNSIFILGIKKALAILGACNYFERKPTQF